MNEVICSAGVTCFVIYSLFYKSCFICWYKKNSVGNIGLVVSKRTCRTELESELSENITKEIGIDLANSGLFNVEHGVEAESKSWKSDAVVTVGLSEVSGSALELSFCLFDTFSKRELLTQSVVFPAKDWRKISHLVSDVMYDRLIGEKGYFNTKITYLSLGSSFKIQQKKSYKKPLNIRNMILLKLAWCSRFKEN